LGYYAILTDTSSYKKTQQSLQEAEALFRQLAENSQEVFWVRELPGRRLIYVNPAYEKIWGRSCASLYQEPESFMEPVHHEDKARMKMAVAHQNQGQPIDEEYRILKPDGTIRWIRVRSFPVANEAGQTYRLVGLAEDITKHKQAEEELRNFIANLPGMFYKMELSSDGTVNFPVVGGRVEDVFHLSLGQLRSDPFLGFRLNPPEVQAEITAYFQEKIQHRRDIDFEYQQSLPNGHLKWLHSRAVPVQQPDGSTTWYGVVIDIDAKKQTEAALRTQEQLFRDVFEQAAVGMAIVDPSGHWLQVNQKLCDIFGYSQEELMALTVHKVVHPDDLAYGLSFARRALNGEIEHYNIEFRCRHKDGSTLWIRLTASLTHQSSGFPRYFVAVLEDITQYKQLEARLLQAQKMDAVGRLAGGIAHDFNNLLVIITGYTDLLLDVYATEDDPTRKDLQQIQKAAQRATELTRQLLAFSRQQISQPRLQNLNDLITDMEKMLRRLIGENIELGFDLAPDLWQVKADAGQVEQIILNLAINARDAMPQGGRLRVATANVALNAEQTFIGLEAGDYVCLTITDTGQGIREKDQPYIFEPFFTTKAAGQGTGLGLSIVYGLIQQSGGHVDVTSQPDQGTRVKIYLPRVEVIEPGSSSSSSGKVAALRGTETVLIVEDDSEVRDLIKKVLSRYGYTLIEARTGAEALSLNDQYPETIDLLLTDVVLPGLNGRQVAEQIQESRPDIKILFMSGYSGNILESQGVSEREIRLLQKPFTPTDLVEAIRTVLN
jgi:PAS domain S-box-containing protein